MHYVQAKGLLSASNGMNVYRGCTHGCIYCDSRSLCYGMEHELEDVEIKRNAPQLLEAALKSKRTRCMIGTGSMCDPYQPLEEREQITRRCLELINKYGFGATLITKSAGVLRDIDLLSAINSRTKAVVQMTLTTYDEGLVRILEPGVSSTRERFETLMKLKEAGIPTVVWLSPILPFINDTEENLMGILDYCFRAGVRGIICFGMGLTLRDGNREYFYRQLDKSFPGMKERYISAFGLSYECDSPQNDRLMEIFHYQCKIHGVSHDNNEIFAYLCEFEEKNEGRQLGLF